LGMSILLFGSLLWSIGSLYSRTATSSPSLFLAAGQQMMCGGGLLLLLGLILREHHDFDPGRITLLSAVAFICLVLIGALIVYTAFFYFLWHFCPAEVGNYV